MFSEVRLMGALLREPCSFGLNQTVVDAALSLLASSISSAILIFILQIIYRHCSEA